MLAINKFRRALDSVARVGLVLLMLGIPTGIALVNLGLLLILVGWILSGNFRWKWNIIWDNPITLPVLLLSALVLFGILYSKAPWNYISTHLYVYSKLPMMLMLLTLLHDSIWRRRALAAFALGCLITLALTYLSVWVYLPWSQASKNGNQISHHIFNDYIAQGLAISFFVALAITYALNSEVFLVKIFWWLISLLAVFSITHLLQGRTGLVVTFSMFLAMGFFVAPPLWRLRFVLIVFLLPLPIYLSSSLVQNGLDRFLVDLYSYRDSGILNTSIGARIDMWKNAVEMFLASPLWGQGTAMFRVLSEEKYSDLSLCSVACIHPHNQYLFFAAEFGLLGLSAYLFIFWRLLRAALELCDDRRRLLLIALLTIMFVDGFINGPLWVTTERHLFATLLPLLAAGLTLRKGGDIAGGHKNSNSSAVKIDLN